MYSKVLILSSHTNLHLHSRSVFPWAHVICESATFSRPSCRSVTYTYLHGNANVPWVTFRLKGCASSSSAVFWNKSHLFCHLDTCLPFPWDYTFSPPPCCWQALSSTEVAPQACISFQQFGWEIGTATSTQASQLRYGKLNELLYKLQQQGEGG